MKRKELLEEIFEQFDIESKTFCEKRGGKFFKIWSKYKKEETTENLKYRFAKIDFSSYSIIFKYTAHSIMSITNSILEAMVYFGGVDDKIGIPLQFIADYYELDTVLPLSIPLISNREGMKQAFGCLSSVIDNLSSKISETSKDFLKVKDIFKYFENELRAFYEIKEEDMSLEDLASEHCYGYFTFRFTSSAYINLLNGKKEKAIKQLEKLKNKTSYENRLLNIIKNKDKIEFCNISCIQQNSSLYNENGVCKTSFKELFSVLFSALASGILFSLVYLGIYYSFIFLESRNSLHLSGPSYSFYVCFLGAFVTGIALSYFTRHISYKLLFKKDSKRILEMDAIQNSVNTDKRMNRFVFVCFAFSVALMFLVVKWNLNFTETGFIDNTKFFDVKGVFYEYEDVEEVYYKSERVNDFGETLNFPSYVIVLKNGKEFDLYDFEDIEQTEEKLIPILKEKGIKIKKELVKN